MAPRTQSTPYQRPSSVSNRSLRLNSTRSGGQSSGSQPSQTSPQPHQLPGSRIQMMLNRSMGNNTIQTSGGSDDLSNVSSNKHFDEGDLNQFNQEDDQPQTNDQTITRDDNDDQRADMDHISTDAPPLEQPATSAATSPSNQSSTHMTGSRLQLFNRLATRAHLDEENQVLGRQLCNFSTGEDQFLACIVTILSVRQEIVLTRDELLEEIVRSPLSRQGSSPDVATWKADSPELKQCLRLLATQCILRGDLQAYTARVDTMGEPDQLPLSLYAKVMSALLSNPSEWKNRVLPPGYGINPDPRHARSLQSAINIALKEVRKAFDDVLLTHINLPNRVQSGTNANVPALDSVIVKLYQKERGLVGGRVRVREEILQEVDQLRTSRYAWLRMQAIHWGLNLAEYEGRSFWNVVDRQLEYLRTQTRRYRYAFFLLVLQSDMQRIDGTKNFEQLKQTTDFSLPTETQIQATMDELNLTFGQEVQPDEEAHDSVPDEAT